MNRFVLFTIALMLTVVTAGCNTMEGLGQDIQKGGAAIQKAAGNNSGNR